MRSRYVGNGGAPRPNEIIQVMLGDLDVNISIGNPGSQERLHSRMLKALQVHLISCSRITYKDSSLPTLEPLLKWKPNFNTAFVIGSSTCF